jgi:hypothetical protein
MSARRSEDIAMDASCRRRVEYYIVGGILKRRSQISPLRCPGFPVEV